jgi:hypothetical protein
MRLGEHERAPPCDRERPWRGGEWLESKTLAQGRPGQDFELSVRGETAYTTHFDVERADDDPNGPFQRNRVNCHAIEQQRAALHVRFDPEPTQVFTHGGQRAVERVAVLADPRLLGRTQRVLEPELGADPVAQGLEREGHLCARPRSRNEIVRLLELHQGVGIPSELAQLEATLEVRLALRRGFVGLARFGYAEEDGHDNDACPTKAALRGHGGKMGAPLSPISGDAACEDLGVDGIDEAATPRPGAEPLTPAPRTVPGVVTTAEGSFSGSGSTAIAGTSVLGVKTSSIEAGDSENDAAIDETIV